MSGMTKIRITSQASLTAAWEPRDVELLALGINSRVELLRNPAMFTSGRKSVEGELQTLMRQLKEVGSVPRQEWPDNFAVVSQGCIKAMVELPQTSTELRDALRALCHALILSDTNLLRMLRHRSPTYGLPCSRPQLQSVARCSFDPKPRNTARSMLVAFAMLQDSQETAGPQSLAVRAQADQAAVGHLTAALQAGAALRPPELARKIKLKSVPQLAQAGWATLAGQLRGVSLQVREAPPLRVSLLEAPDGRSWVVSSRFANGTAGKCRIAVPLTGASDSEPVAIKELRREVPVAQGASSRTRRNSPVTVVTSDAEAQAEFWQLVALHGHALALGMVTTAKSNFIIQTLMDTDAVELVNTLSRTEHPAAQVAQGKALRFHLFVEAGLQLSQQLATWHAKTGAHCPDLKFDNILVHRNGSFWLADIGNQGNWNARRGLFLDGTFTLEYLAPEILLSGGRTQADDVWSLCVSLLLMAIPGNGPFIGSKDPASTGVRYIRWHDGLKRNEKNLIDPTQLRVDSLNSFERYFADLTALHSDTAAIFLNFALHPRRKERLSSQDLADWFQSKDGPPRKYQDVKQFLAEAANENADRSATITILQAYAQVLKSGKR
jgi:hypothetical protein